MKGARNCEHEPNFASKKYARIVECFSAKAGISLAEALDFFYHSETYPLISQGVSDLHCMSDEYLADALLQVYQKNTAHLIITDCEMQEN